MKKQNEIDDEDINFIDDEEEKELEDEENQDDDKGTESPEEKLADRQKTPVNDPTKASAQPIQTVKKPEAEVAQQYLLKQREEELKKLAADFNKRLSDLFKSDVDTLVKTYVGAQDFPLMLEIKKVEILEDIAISLHERGGKK